MYSKINQERPGMNRNLENGMEFIDFLNPLVGLDLNKGRNPFTDGSSLDQHVKSICK